MHFLANNGYHYHAFSCTSVFIFIFYFNETFFLSLLFILLYFCFSFSLMWEGGKKCTKIIFKQNKKKNTVCLFV